jgi:hypothetical protein
MIMWRTMIPIPRPARFIAISFAALTLAACAVGGGSSFDFFKTAAAPGAMAQPKSFVVSDFIFSDDVTAVDRSYTARLQRKIGAFPTHERKQRTLERVNDEIVAAIIATLDQAGLKAGPGREEGLSLNDDVVLVSGRLRAADNVKLGKDKQVGFGVGDARVTADVAVSHFSGGGKNLLLQFNTQTPGGRAGRLDRKQQAARNAAIEAALLAEGTPAVTLSPAVETQARAMGRAIGERIVAFARERGWLATADTVAAMPEQSAPKRSPPHSAQPGGM